MRHGDLATAKREGKHGGRHRGGEGDERRSRKSRRERERIRGFGRKVLGGNLGREKKKKE